MSKRALDAASKVYPPETAFVEINSLRFVKTDRRAAYIKGYEQAEKDTIERAMEWLFSNVHDYLYCCVELKAAGIDQDFFADFKEAMEKE